MQMTSTFTFMLGLLIVGCYVCWKALNVLYVDKDTYTPMIIAFWVISNLVRNTMLKSYPYETVYCDNGIQIIAITCAIALSIAHPIVKYSHNQNQKQIN